MKYVPDHIERAAGNRPEPDRRTQMLRLGLGTPVRTLAEVADILGTSPEVARGLEQSALDKLTARS